MADIAADNDPRPFEFQRNSDGTPLSLHDLVFQALGFASTCWEDLSGSGVFQSDDATRCGDALVREIQGMMAKQIDDVVKARRWPFAIDAVHLERQRDWSLDTFGPKRGMGVLDHIRKELVEIEDAMGTPEELGEWVDAIILSLDGAWRSGANPQEILNAVLLKQVRNEARTWPDWRTQPANVAIEHVHDGNPETD